MANFYDIWSMIQTSYSDNSTKLRVVCATHVDIIKRASLPSLFKTIRIFFIEGYLWMRKSHTWFKERYFQPQLLV